MSNDLWWREAIGYLSFPQGGQSLQAEHQTLAFGCQGWHHFPECRCSHWCRQSYPPITPLVDQLRCLELFSGGYGGWNFGLDPIKRLCGTDFRVVAVDNDLEACRNYSLTHETKLISGYRKLPDAVLDLFTANCVLHADISSMTWLPPVVRWRPLLVFINALCLPSFGIDNVLSVCRTFCHNPWANGTGLVPWLVPGFCCPPFRAICVAVIL